MNQLAPHQQRVVDEKRELDEKLHKLSAFISSEKFTTIVQDEAERARLVCQEETMRDYSAILAERIEAFGCALTTLPVVDPGPDSLERGFDRIHKVQEDALLAVAQGSNDVDLLCGRTSFAVPIEQEIQAKASKGPRVTPFEVEAHIRSEFYFTAEQGVLGESELGTRPASWTNLDQVTICVLILTNGTKIVGVNEGPVSRENFKADLGRQYARQKAVDQIWPLLGFRLRDELARPVLTDADAAADLAGTPRPSQEGVGN